jgi:type IV secretion system protein VirB9
MMRALRFRFAMLLAATALAACSGYTPPEIAYDDAKPAVRQPDASVQVAKLPPNFRLPGQVKRLNARSSHRPEPGNPTARVDLANAAARMQPSRHGYINAVQVYPWSDGALYEVYTAPEQVTDIALEPGEQLAGTGPIAAGDTVRWVIGNTESGTGPTRRIHVLVKPTRPDLSTNIVINTDRRTYLIELRSTEKTYMASVSWQYAQDKLIAVHGPNGLAAASPIDAGLDLAALRFRYAVEGDRPPWRPVRAFDDGHKVYIEFPSGISQGEMPPLFVLGPEGGAQLVNYRARGNYFIVDRLFAAAELRLGGDNQQKVRIVRTDGRSA